MVCTKMGAGVVGPILCAIVVEGGLVVLCTRPAVPMAAVLGAAGSGSEAEGGADLEPEDEEEAPATEHPRPSRWQHQSFLSSDHSTCHNFSPERQSKDVSEAFAPLSSVVFLDLAGMGASGSSKTQCSRFRSAKENAASAAFVRTACFIN